MRRNLFAAATILLGLAAVQVYGQTNLGNAAGAAGNAAAGATNAAGNAAVGAVNAAGNTAAGAANTANNAVNSAASTIPPVGVNAQGQVQGNTQVGVNGQPNVGVQGNAQGNIQSNGLPGQSYQGGYAHGSIGANTNFINDNRPDPWRYRVDNGRWWYWAPDNRWMLYDNNQWTNYQPGEGGITAPAYVPGPYNQSAPGYTANYGGYESAPGYNGGYNTGYSGGYYNNCNGYGYGGRYGYRRGWRW
jgi:hypothetical protein